MNVEDANPEMNAYREFKAAAVDLQEQNQKYQAAQKRYSEALNNLNNLVAPPPK